MTGFYAKTEEMNNVSFRKIQWRLFANIQNTHALKHDVNIAIERIAKMPPKNIETGQLYFEINGELRPFTEAKGIENIGIESDEKIEISEFPEYEATFTLSRKPSKKLKKLFIATRPKIFINNWRKMHHLPLIRRREKRK